MVLVMSCRCASQKHAAERERGPEPEPVWIDTDPAVGVTDRDVDDGFALVQAFHTPEIVVRGVSVVFGNTDLEHAEQIAREIAGRAGPAGLGVFRGSASAKDLGLETPATRALIAALEHETLTLLVLGPATNVASVLRLRPDLAPRIRSLVAVAGRRPGQRFTTGTRNPKAHRDFNFELDSAAFEIILATEIPIVLAPFEVSSKVWITEAELQRLEAGPESIRWMIEPARRWLALWQSVFGADGFNPFDTLAVAAVARPDLVWCEKIAVSIRVLPDDVSEARMQGVEPAERSDKPYLLVEANTGPEPVRTVTYCHTPSPLFKAWLMERLLSR